MFNLNLVESRIGCAQGSPALPEPLSGYHRCTLQKTSGIESVGSRYGPTRVKRRHSTDPTLALDCAALISAAFKMGAIAASI